MDFKNNNKPVWTLSVDEFIEIIEKVMKSSISEHVHYKKEKNVVFGIEGISSIFGCSLATANRIKKSGIIDGAITQVGRKVIVDVEKARELAKQSELNNDKLWKKE